MSILPGLPEHHEEAQRPITIELPQFGHVQQEHRDQQARLLMDRNKATLLLEKLRYKSYVRRGTLGTWMQTVGDGVRQNKGHWIEIVYWTGVLYLASKFRS